MQKYNVMAEDEELYPSWKIACFFGLETGIEMLGRRQEKGDCTCSGPLIICYAHSYVVTCGWRTLSARQFELAE